MGQALAYSRTRAGRYGYLGQCQCSQKPQALRGLQSSGNRPVIASNLFSRFKPRREADRRSFEPFWRWLKAWIRQLNQPNLHISQALTEVFKTIPG